MHKYIHIHTTLTLITIGNHVHLSSTCQIQCHTFEHRQLKLCPVKISSYCMIKEMSFILPGVEFHGYNYLYPCSLALLDDQFKLHTDWFGSPTKRRIVHYGIEPPRLILGKQPSSIDRYDVIVARTDDENLILYFGDNGWMNYFLQVFSCVAKPKRILIVGLVVDLAEKFFGLEEAIKNNCLNVNETTHRYDMIFIDAFVEDAIPFHINSKQFFLNIHRVLNNNGCLVTSLNVPSTLVFNEITQLLTSAFDSNISLAHTNTIENARAIISGNESSLRSVSS
ncbi:hypothetical protein I4U23_010987 [Adineta vaga]|nr:hypothetical protein I4U23_010987 [Adineta vaga]